MKNVPFLIAILLAAASAFPATAPAQTDLTSPTGGVILTAPTIIDGGLELSPDADPALWHQVKTDTSIALYHHRPTTIIIVR